jgi:hypothetical protein
MRAAPDGSHYLPCAVPRIPRGAPHIDVAAVAVGVGAKQASPMSLLFHLQPLDSAKETASSTSLFGYLTEDQLADVTAYTMTLREHGANR